MKEPSLHLNSDRKLILSLAWPVILNNLLLTFVWMVDMVMVGRLGSTAVAAVGVSGQMFNIIMAITLAVTTGTVALVARYTGANESESANTVLGQSLLLAVIFSIFLMIPPLAASETFFRVFGAEADVSRVGAPYLRIVSVGTIFIVIALVCSSALRGAGDTKTPLVISVSANVLKIVLNYFLIFGKLGAPKLGVTGAAIATVIAFFAEAAACLVVLSGGKAVLTLPRRFFRLEKEIAVKTLRIGSPSAIDQGLMQLGYLWYLAVVTRYGTGPLAAYTIGVNIMSLSFMPGFGFSVAASTLVGQALGAKKHDVAASQGWECSKMALWTMSLVGVILFVAARQTALIYVSEGGVVAHTANFVRILALCQPAMAIHYSLTGALIGAADTRWPLYGSFVGMYLFRLPLAMLASYILGLNVIWIWLVILADHYAKALVLSLRFLSGKWKRIAV